jgi:hypothetical protein
MPQMAETYHDRNVLSNLVQNTYLHQVKLLFKYNPFNYEYGDQW